MSVETARTAIESRFKAAWSAAHPAMPICYENVAFNPPSAGAQWARITVRPGAEEQVSTGLVQNRYRHVGVIYIDIFGTQGVGVGPTEALAAEAAAIFRSETFSGVTCREPEIRAMGTDKSWYRHQAQIAYRSDDYH